MSGRIRATAGFKKFQRYRWRVAMCSGQREVPSQVGLNVGGREGYYPEYYYELGLFRMHPTPYGYAPKFQRCADDGKRFNERWRAEHWLATRGYEHEFFRYENAEHPLVVYKRKRATYLRRRKYGDKCSPPRPRTCSRQQAREANEFLDSLCQ